jgi:hypothetical protein
MVEIIGATSSNVVARPSQRGFSKAIASNSVRGTALFSFEGMNLDASRFDHVGFGQSDANG